MTLIFRCKFWEKNLSSLLTRQLNKVKEKNNKNAIDLSRPFPQEKKLAWFTFFFYKFSPFLALLLYDKSTFSRIFKMPSPVDIKHNFWKWHLQKLGAKLIFRPQDVGLTGYPWPSRLTIIVLLLPPRAFCSNLVSTESL